MKKTLILMLCTFSVIFSISIQCFAAVDLSAGEQIFSANCAACHAGGNNVIAPAKTLKKDVLEENEMNTVEAITTQVTNGKNAMPAFGGRLGDQDIENVANYVIDQSQKGW